MAVTLQVHPDVNHLRDTHEQATALNQAYEVLQRAWVSTGHVELHDVFDDPEGAPDLLFVNPFACNVSPLLWRELQARIMFLYNNLCSTCRCGLADCWF